MFEVFTQEIDTPALRMSYHRAPWDEATIGAPVAAISAIQVVDEPAARSKFMAFKDWCFREGVALASCRLPQDRLLECGFLEAQGFRFIELNYRPERSGLQTMDLGEPDGLRVLPATAADEEAICGIAGQVFEAGRFHDDPLIGARIGNRRYEHWAANAFRNPAQSVLKCLDAERVIGFFVFERPEPTRRFWSLVGLAPGIGGRGMGFRVWRAVLRWHRDEGVDYVSTSISSHNTAVHNLYVKLGFRFPAPAITLHWCPRGRIGGPA